MGCRFFITVSVMTLHMCAFCDSEQRSQAQDDACSLEGGTHTEHLLEFFALPATLACEGEQVVICAAEPGETALRCQGTGGTEGGIEEAVRGLPRTPKRLVKGIPMIEGSTFDMWVLEGGDYPSNLISNTHAVGVEVTIMMAQLLVQHCIDPGGPRLLVDVGCNLGYFSILALNLGCDVVCVEPNPVLIPVIAHSAVRSINENNLQGRIVIVHAAAGAEPGLVGLLVSANHSGLSHVDASALESKSQTELVKVEVPVVSVGKLLTRSASMLKIDVEGFEAEVAKGLSEWLDAHGFQDSVVEVGDRDADTTLRTLLRGCKGDPELSAITETHWSHEMKTRLGERWDMSADQTHRVPAQGPYPRNKDIVICCRY